QSVDDFARHGRGARENLRRFDRLGVHAYSGSTRTRMDPAATGNTSTQTFNATGDPGRAVAGLAGSRILRDFSAYPLCRTKTFLVTRSGNTDGRSGNNLAQMPGRRR